MATLSKHKQVITDSVEDIYEISLKQISIETNCVVNGKETGVTIEFINQADIFDSYNLKFADGTEFEVSRIIESPEWRIENEIQENYKAYLQAIEPKLDEMYNLDCSNEKDILSSEN